MISLLEEKLNTAFAPSHCEVLDESAQHAGHSGSRPGGNTHFRLTIVSERFSGLSRVARHRLVYEVLQPDIDNGIHALALHLYAPGENR